MVTLVCSHIWKKTLYEKFHYMLENPELNRFINTRLVELTALIYEIYKKILFLIIFYFSNCLKLCSNIWEQNSQNLTMDNSRILLLNINKDNQQETKIWEQNSQKESSETVCENSFNFSEYKLHLPEHKKKINSKNLEWFIGFTEGDGSFIVSKNKIYFDITQSLVDIKILYYIKKELGFGKILQRKETNRSVGVYYITGKENFTRLIHIFNGNIICPHKKTQFKLWLQTYNLQYRENIKYIDQNKELNLDNGWLSGFIDAEGYFGARIKNCRTSRLKKQILTEFSIGQKDKEILILILSLFISDSDKKLYVTYDKSWNGYRFCLSNKNLLIKLVKYLNLYPLKTIKSINYNNWLKIYSACVDKISSTSEGIEKLSIMIDKFNNEAPRRKKKIKIQSDPLWE